MEIRINDVFYACLQTNRQDYGVASGWSCFITDQATGITSLSSATFSETMMIVDAPRIAVASGVQLSSSYDVYVKDGHSLLPGDVFDDGAGNKYYILSVNANTIRLKVGLVAEISSDTVLTQVGNTGLYRAPITISTEGYYAITISNVGLNIHDTEPIQVMAETTADEIDALRVEVRKLRFKTIV